MSMISRRFAATSAAVVLLACSVPAQAEIFYYRLDFNGGESGDRDASGHGTLSLDSETGRVIWGIYYSGIAAPTAMHIHRGADSQSGGVILALNVESKLGDGALTGRVVADIDLVQEILGDPASYYVNIHNDEYRQGAARAQLGLEWDNVR